MSIGLDSAVHGMYCGSLAVPFFALPISSPSEEREKSQETFRDEQRQIDGRCAVQQHHQANPNHRNGA